MPFPVAHAIIGATIVTVTRPSEDPDSRWKYLCLGAILATIPDLDSVFPWYFHLSWHRTFTHSITFALAAGLLASGTLGTFKIREIVVFGLACLSHALMDFFSTNANAGVQLLWPLSYHKYKLGLFSYPEFHVDPRHQSVTESVMNMLKMSCIESMLFLPLCLLISYFLWRVEPKAAKVSDI